MAEIDLDQLAQRHGIRLLLQFGSTVGGQVHVDYHLITDAGHAPPRDYYASFTELAKLRILPPAFASQIAMCAGLRNRLVHEYDEIDPRRVHEGLLAAVRDFPEYLRPVHSYIEGTPE